MSLLGSMFQRKPVLFFVWIEGCEVCARMKKSIDALEAKGAGRFVEIRRLHAVGAEEAMGVKIDAAPFLMLRFADGRTWKASRRAINNSMSTYDIARWIHAGMQKQEAA